MSKDRKYYSEEEKIEAGYERAVALLPQWYREFIDSTDLSIAAKKSYAISVSYLFEFLRQTKPQYKDYTYSSFSTEEIISIEPNDIADFIDELKSGKLQRVSDSMDFILDVAPLSEEELKKQKPISEATLNARIQAIRHMYELLIYHELLYRNPFKGAVSTKSVKTKALSYLSEEDQERLLEVAESGEGLSKTQLQHHNPKRDKALIFMLLDTGMKVSEVCNLDMSDFDRERQIVIVRKENDQFIYKVSSACCDCLLEYLDSKVFDSSALEPLFTNTYNYNRMIPDSVQDVVSKYSKIAFAGSNKEKTHPQILRNSYAVKHNLMVAHY